MSKGEAHQLEQTLKRLKEELSKSPSVSRDARELLEGAMREIASLLESEDQGASRSHQSLVGRLRGVRGDFEQSHPALTRAVGDVAEVLSRMGI